MDYALSQWSTLEVYLDEGRVEIDNNLVERAIRPKRARRTGSSSGKPPSETAALSSTR